MIIDVYSHILPESYLANLIKKSQKAAQCIEVKNPIVTNLDTRFKFMDLHPEVLQVLTIALPPLDAVVGPDEASELCQIANDEVAELVTRFPSRFLCGVACLPLNDIDAALQETDRAITQLGLKGIQIFARSEGEDLLDNPKFKPLYEKMAAYDLPIWIHPVSSPAQDNPINGIFGWPYATSVSMLRLVTAGTFIDFPDIKFITHHCGAMVPTMEGRIRSLLPLVMGTDKPSQYWLDQFRKFYNDTATYGSTTALMGSYSFFGGDHLLFGTDAPLGCPNTGGLTTETIEAVQRMAIPASDKSKIFSQNAKILLQIKV